MHIFVLTQTDSYDRSAILGLFSQEDWAKEAAQACEPTRTFRWKAEEKSWYAPCYHLGVDPIYNYEIERFEVDPPKEEVIQNTH